WRLLKPPPFWFKNQANPVHPPTYLPPSPARYSSLRSSGIQLQAGTEFIHLAPLCLSLIQSSIHPTMGANQFLLSYRFIKK
ncbi:hypothetical protein ATANTOWER_004912, partial [Ataeniobius toweri]|nr:hypothetical protein [Ataeniobius toweri]